MRELDKNKVYDLSELTSEELTKLIDYLKNNYSNWNYFVKIYDGHTLHFSKRAKKWYQGTKQPTTNAKELFYTLENIQVDCRGLSEEQIENMKEVVVKNGYTLWDLKTAFELSNLAYYFVKNNGDTDFLLSINSRDRYTITYEKFMELFSNKEDNFKKLVEVLNEELTEKAYKGTEYEVKYIAEKPKQYQIGIDTFERCEANMTKEEILACVRFNIDKYNFRVKGQDLEDLEKIIAYANWGIKQLKK